MQPHAPRYLPDEPFPAYAFVPRRYPHPTCDPAGHAYGREPQRADPPDPDRWAECRPYLRGIDLFNHGYYWEAHEVWESLWHACGRGGATGEFLRGLIRLAAAGVKVREDRPNGVRRHAAAALGLFRQVAAELGSPEARYMGLELDELGRLAAAVAAGQGVVPVLPEARVVFGFVLRPA